MLVLLIELSTKASALACLYNQVAVKFISVSIKKSSDQCKLFSGLGL